MSNERIYPRLTNEEKKHVLDQFRKIVESGDIGPTLHDSLIGIQQNDFNVTWPGLTAEQSGKYRVPGELTTYAYNGIDAYATALLATDTLFAPNCRMTAYCSFQKNEGGSLTLRYYSKTDRLTPELFGVRVAQFLQGFVAALASKGIEPKSPIFCNKVKAPAWFGFPGQMVLSKSVLASLPEANWPVASRSFIVTEELRAAARNAILLLTTPENKMYRDPA
jgi:hypothetical protein